MISRSFERRERTARRTSAINKRYMRRYTRTQHRPPSRQVNDHGRISGTHRRSRPNLALIEGRVTPCDMCGWRVTRQCALPAHGDRSSALPGTSHSRVRRRGLGSSSRCWCRPRPEQLVDGDELTEEVIDCLRHQEIHGHISFGCGFEKTRVQRFTQPDGSRHSWFLVTGSPCHGTHHMRCSRASGGCRAR